MRWLVPLAVWTAVLVGAVGGVLALRSRGSQEAFRYQQSAALGAGGGATVLSAARVEAWVTKAPEPVRPAKRTPPALVRCRPGPSRVLHNPWSCTIRYRSGTHAYYSVNVHPDGFYVGTGTGIIEGCCIKTPALD
ncbi:MAG TPA: hypothetical protein VGY30_12700 [Solirubrobacteraceae bacterium]|jgi:hypothetical protein|nr:hypothetical protein [Solirubrobacteraceae bacterium]